MLRKDFYRNLSNMIVTFDWYKIYITIKAIKAAINVLLLFDYGYKCVNGILLTEIFKVTKCLFTIPLIL